MSKGSILDGKAWELLSQFELILESDPLIDELGFVHPTQFVNLAEEAGSSLVSSKDGISDNKSGNFWSRDHKLGISTNVVLPLYKAAKEVFMGVFRQYKRFENNLSDDSCLEIEVLKHSKAVLLLSCDFGTAWNSRKLIVSKKQEMSMFIDELMLSALVLSCSHKSDQAWCHRRWVIKMIAGKCQTFQEIVGKESELVEKIVEISKMNYRAWNHRCWLVSYMTREQVLQELSKSRNWAGLHVADNSCFHYRTRLILRILEDFPNEKEEESPDRKNEVYQIWQEELDWNEALINCYIGREALWLYRRFLSLVRLRQLSTHVKDSCHHSEHKSSIDDHIDIFLDNEMRLVNACSKVPDNKFEDFQAQAIHSATYILWLAKQTPKSQQNELQEKLRGSSLKNMLNMAYPERSSLWSHLMS